MPADVELVVLLGKLKTDLVELVVLQILSVVDDLSLVFIDEDLLPHEVDKALAVLLRPHGTQFVFALAHEVNFEEVLHLLEVEAPLLFGQDLVDHYLGKVIGLRWGFGW